MPMQGAGLVPQVGAGAGGPDLLSAGQATRTPGCRTHGVCGVESWCAYVCDVVSWCVMWCHSVRMCVIPFGIKGADPKNSSGGFAWSECSL